MTFRIIQRTHTLSFRRVAVSSYTRISEYICKCIRVYVYSPVLQSLTLSFRFSRLRWQLMCYGILLSCDGPNYMLTQRGNTQILPPWGKPHPEKGEHFNKLNSNGCQRLTFSLRFSANASDRSQLILAHILLSRLQKWLLQWKHRWQDKTINCTTSTDSYNCWSYFNFKVRFFSFPNGQPKTATKFNWNAAESKEKSPKYQWHREKCYKKGTKEEIVVKSYLSPFLCCKQSIAFEPNNQGRYNAQ